MKLISSLRSKFDAFKSEVQALPREAFLIIGISSLGMSLALSLSINPAASRGIQFMGFKQLLFSLLISVLVALFTAVQIHRERCGSSNRRRTATLLALSLLYACFFVIGQSLQASNGLGLLYQTPLHIACTLMRYIGLAAFSFCVLTVLFAVCDSVRYAVDTTPPPATYPLILP